MKVRKQCHNLYLKLQKEESCVTLAVSTFFNFNHKLRRIETSHRKTVFTIRTWLLPNLILYITYTSE